MIRLRPAEQRGHADHGWLDTYHTFSFADYHDPGQMGFRSLRVINDDRVAAGEGFGAHPHRDMEIITYMVEGELEHRDSMGNGAVLTPGMVQHMTAGTGVVHSEFSHSQSKPLRLLQIWIFPEKRGLVPGYQDRRFDPASRKDRLRLIASTDGRDDSLIVNQDVDLYDGELTKGSEVSLSLRSGRAAWVQVINGELSLNGKLLKAGDGASVQDEERLTVSGSSGRSEFLLFDLA